MHWTESENVLDIAFPKEGIKYQVTSSDCPRFDILCLRSKRILIKCKRTSLRLELEIPAVVVGKYQVCDHPKFGLLS